MKGQEKYPQPNDKLRRERELRGWSQRVVAQYIGTTEQVVTRWENGFHKPNRYYQTQLCKLFSKSAEEPGFMDIRVVEEKSQKDSSNASTSRHPFLFSLKSDNEQQGPPSLLFPTVIENIIGGKQEGVIDLKALSSAEWAEDTNLQATSLIRLANLHFHRKQSLSSLRTYQQALSLLDGISPLLRGRIYVGLAEVYAMRHQQQEALRSMGLAHEHFPEHPEQDPVYDYTHFSRLLSMSLEKGSHDSPSTSPSKLRRVFTMQRETCSR